MAEVNLLPRLLRSTRTSSSSISSPGMRIVSDVGRYMSKPVAWGDERTDGWMRGV